MFRKPPPVVLAPSHVVLTLPLEEPMLLIQVDDQPLGGQRTHDLTDAMVPFVRPRIRDTRRAGIAIVTVPTDGSGDL
jgi:hypothetical protein